jgi:histidinol-phosphate aminotransferase
MPVTRRAFLRRVGTSTRLTPPPSAPVLAARGHEAWVGEGGPIGGQAASGTGPAAIRLNTNENPLGPGPSALAAIEAAFAFSGRYPPNARPAHGDFQALVARKNGVVPENVSLGAGSGEILENAVRAFTSARRGLVTAAPTFESPTRIARQIGSEAVEIPVLDDGRLDCDRMIAAATGAGLVFVCNPNNPTGTVHAASTIADLVARIRRASPDTVILIDEAYHEYATDPAYATAMPLVRQHPNVLISRTLSKAYGMAGLRLGYAVGSAEVLARLARWAMVFNANTLAVAAGCAALEDEPQLARERRRNSEALKFTTDFFRAAGMKTADSQANFAWVDLGRPAAPFRQGCAARGILVGRPFPPLDRSHCRISIGTMEEMQRAVDVFRSVLGVPERTADGV